MLKQLDAEVAEAKCDLEVQKAWDAGATEKQTLRLLKAQRHEVAHRVRVLGAD